MLSDHYRFHKCKELQFEWGAITHADVNAKCLSHANLITVTATTETCKQRTFSITATADTFSGLLKASPRN